MRNRVEVSETVVAVALLSELPIIDSKREEEAREEFEKRTCVTLGGWKHAHFFSSTSCTRSVFTQLILQTVDLSFLTLISHLLHIDNQIISSQPLCFLLLLIARKYAWLRIHWNRSSCSDGFDSSMYQSLPKCYWLLAVGRFCRKEVCSGYSTVWSMWKEIVQRGWEGGHCVTQSESCNDF